MNEKIRKFIFDLKKNIVAIMIYIAFMFLISPLFPGVTWFELGDFTLYVVNYYHGIMIPLTLLIIIVTAKIFKIPDKLYKFILLTNYPVLVLSFLGLVLFYPSWATNADIVAQAIRDIIMMVDALVLIIGLIIFPFKNKTDFRNVLAGYLLVTVTAISATIAAFMGMVYEYGNLYTFSAIPFFNSYVNSVGGISTFLGNLLTSHSHQMLPAVMGGIVGLTATIFGYYKLNPKYKAIASIGLYISFLGVVSMSYLYWISSFGTYTIPSIFTSGPGGVNGLALDDSQTGIIGVGALIAIIGLVKTFNSTKGLKMLQIAAISTWIGAVASLLGIGYVIEFNESFYGFGSPGIPPNGGSGYLYDMAFMNGHLLYPFFMLVIVAAFFMVGYYLFKNMDNVPILPSYLALSGIVLGYEGLLIYTMTLSWIVEAIGLCLLFISLAYITWIAIKSKSIENSTI